MSIGQTVRKFFAPAVAIGALCTGPGCAINQGGGIVPKPERGLGERLAATIAGPQTSKQEEALKPLSPQAPKLRPVPSSEVDHAGYSDEAPSDEPVLGFPSVDENGVFKASVTGANIADGKVIVEVNPDGSTKLKRTDLPAVSANKVSE